MTNEKRWERMLGELNAEFHRVTRALEVILQVDRHIFASAPVLKDVFQEMLLGIQNATEAEHVQILLRHDSTLRIEHSTQESDKEKVFVLSDCVSGLAVEENRTVAELRVREKHPRRYKAVFGEGKGMESEIAVPIRRDQGSMIIGVLNVEWPEPDGFDDMDVEIIEQFALQAAAAIDSVRQREALSLTLRLAELIHSMPYRDAIRQTLEELAKSFPFEVVIQFLLLSRDAQLLVIEASTKMDTETVAVLVNDSVSGIAALENRAVRSGNVAEKFGEKFKSTVADSGGPWIKSELAVPIHESGRVIGVLNLESPEPDAFTEHDEYLVTLLANTGVWNRSREADRQRALSAMATVGDVAAGLVHILTNRLPLLYETSKQVVALADRNAPPDEIKTASEQVLVAATGFGERVEKLRERYQNALAGNAPMKLNEVVKRQAREINSRNNSESPDYIHIDYQLDRSLGELKLPRGIGDVLWNLLSNANAAIPNDRRGTITIRTRLHCGKYTGKPEMLEICVRDDGRGISREEQKTLYDLKFKEGAHGFGLWWIKKFVDRFDGTIELNSDVDQGAVFKLSFPLTSLGEMRSLVEVEAVS